MGDALTQPSAKVNEVTAIRNEGAWWFVFGACFPRDRHGCDHRVHGRQMVGWPEGRAQLKHLITEFHRFVNVDASLGIGIDIAYEMRKGLWEEPHERAWQ